MADLTQQDRDRLRTMTEGEWVDACVNGDWNAAVALCTEDIDYMPADSPWLRGRDQVKEFLTGFPDIVDMSQELLAIEGSTDLAVMHGTFGGSFIVEGQGMKGQGKVIATARKQGGEWLFSSVCFNWNAPPAVSS